MPTQGPSFAGSGSGWTNSGNVGASDGAYASSSWSRIFNGGDGVWENTPTAYLTASGFGFALGAGDTVNGVTVEVKGNRTGPTGTLYAFLAVSGSQVGAAKSSSLNAAGDTVFTFGSSVDGWSAGLNGTQANALQVVIYADPSGGSGVGTVSVDYVKATLDYVDTTPDAFDFTDISGQPTNTLVTSNSQTISGITGTSAVSLSNNFFGVSEWEKNNSGTWSSTGGTVVNGDTVRVRHLTATTYNTNRITALTIGGVSGDFQTATIVADQTCDAFSFPDTNGVNPATNADSALVQITGINVPTPFTVTGATATINWGGGGTGLASGNVNNNDYVYLSRTSSASFATLVSSILNVNGVSGTWNVTTRAANLQPTAYTWTDVPTAVTSTTYTSNTVTMAGLEGAVTCTFTSTGTGTTPQYSKNGAGFLALPASVGLVNGDTLALRVTAPAGAPQTHNITTDIGSPARTDTWSVTTGDNTPDAFSFPAKSAPPGQSVTSANASITGVTVACAVNVDNGAQVSINGGGFVSSGSITSGQTLAVKVNAPIRKGATTTVNVTVGTVTVQFAVTAQGPVDGDF